MKKFLEPELLVVNFNEELILEGSPIKEDTFGDNGSNKIEF